MLMDFYDSIRLITPSYLSNRAKQRHAQKMLMQHTTTWPIDRHAGMQPPNWPGWPHGNQFAFVLTHDVEHARGLHRIPELLNLDKSFGLSASFNLAVDGEYNVPPSLLAYIAENHFETAIHGSYHGQQRYISSRSFESKAPEFRRHLNKWNSVGFRSPAMRQHLGWLHALGCEYDSSTYDTYPFDPQIDGVGTIYPFWVPSNKGDGFVELPNTIVPDDTLFNVLQQRDIAFWINKLDWIAERGGLALITIHPDFICFRGREAHNEYPVSYYERFLRYLTERYRGRYWNALPREVARYYCSVLPEKKRNTRRKICMLAYTDYACDNRVRRYAETLARRGDSVDSVALAGNSESDSGGSLKGVTLYKVQKRSFNQRTEWDFIIPQLLFFWRSARMLTRMHRRAHYDVIHVHNIPDFLVFAAWYPKLTGARIVLDIHDIVPELFANKFSTSLRGAYVYLLKLIEKLSAHFADHVIVSNDLWHDKLVARSVPSDRCSVFVNHVDPELFVRKQRTREDGRYIVIFPGTFQPHQGLDIGMDAFARFRKHIPNAEFHLYGGGNNAVENELRQQVQRLGLEESVKFLGLISLDRMPEVISNADLGVVPKRADSFGNEAYSTKIMEFLSQGIPVVASRTSIDTFYFQEGTVHFFESGNPASMASAMLDVATDEQLRTSLVCKGLEYVQLHGWQKRQHDYLALIDALSTRPIRIVDHN